MSGLVSDRAPLAFAQVDIRDAHGKQLTAHTDEHGIYRIRLQDLTPPLIISAIEAGGNTNCLYHHQPRARCFAAALPDWQPGRDNTANVNALTDRIVSDIARTLDLIGPQQLVERKSHPDVSADLIHSASARLRDNFSPVLTRLGIAGDYDPVRWPVARHTQVAPLLAVINHNRNYHNDSGQAGQTVLTDINFRPIASLADIRDEPLDLERAQEDLRRIEQADIRIFIVGDSTAATYEIQRAPRMGWGQVFEDFFQPDANIKVINGARAGRSSRDFYNGGWFRQMETWIRPGDYVFIHHGHNDQNCNSARPMRGIADVANLCTYPNHPRTGEPQFPPGQPELSFQHSLERYITIARQKGAHPIMLTPTARVLKADRSQGVPAAHSHFTRQNAEGGYAFVGDYAQTVRITAQLNQLPLIDISQRSLDFVNSLEGDQWQDYWMVVDPVQYPYYTNMHGSLTQPDTTHFQERGARAIAAMVAQALRETPELTALSSKLLPP